MTASCPDRPGCHFGVHHWGGVARRYEGGEPQIEATRLLWLPRTGRGFACVLGQMVNKKFLFLQ